MDIIQSFFFDTKIQESGRNVSLELERKFKSKGSNVKKNWFWHSLAIGICFIFLLCRNSKFKIFICFFDFIEIMNSLLESFEKKVQQPCFYSFMQFSMCISLLFDLLTQVTTKIILIFFSLKTSFWCNVFFETCFFFSQNNVTLFRNKGFLVNLKTKRNASKFAMFMEKENPRSFFRFSFRATFIFPLWMPWSMST